MKLDREQFQLNLLIAKKLVTKLNRIFTFYPNSQIIKQVLTMNYHDIPMIIPVLATVYVLTVYLLLMLAEKSRKTNKFRVETIQESDHNQFTTKPETGVF